MARGGKRVNAGRKRGKKEPQTLEREKILEALRQRTMKIAGNLLDKQLILAYGYQMLYKIEKEFIKTGTNKKTGEDNGYYRNKKPVLVTIEEEVRLYIENQVDLANGDMEDNKDPAATYYFIVTKAPDGRTLDSVLNRTFGTPVQSTKIVGDDGKSIPIGSISVVPVSAKL